MPGGEDHKAGEFARNHRYKLYLEGGFYDVPADFYERNSLKPDKLTEEQWEMRSQLRSVIQQQTRQGFYNEAK